MTFDSILETFWHLLAPLGFQLGFRSMFQFLLLFVDFQEVPPKSYTLILGGKMGFWTPIPQNPDYRQLTSDLQSALSSEGKGNRQQKWRFVTMIYQEMRICDQDQFPTSAAWWPLATRGRRIFSSSESCTLSVVKVGSMCFFLKLSNLSEWDSIVENLIWLCCGICCTLRNPQLTYHEK